MPSFFAASGVSPAQNTLPVKSAIAHAAERTGGDFDFLLAQARIESGLDADAKAKTSSAAGLYQFIGQTWLETVNAHGEEHGLGWAADAIEMRGGRAVVADPQMRSAILQMRYDPQAASLMAGEFARDNADHLSNEFGRQPDNTELYLAHFLGAAGASKFISAHDGDPGAAAAPHFPQAARANRSIFFDKGSPRSLSEVRDLFSAKLEKAGDQGAAFGTPSFAPSALGSAGAQIAAASAAQASAAQNMSQAAGRFSGQSARNIPAQNRAPLPMPAAPSLPPMADVLRSTFGAAGELPGRAGAQVSKAYAQFERFGL